MQRQIEQQIKLTFSQGNVLVLNKDDALSGIYLERACFDDACDCRMIAAKDKGARVNIEKVQKIVKTVRNNELLVEFKNR